MFRTIINAENQIQYKANQYVSNYPRWKQTKNDSVETAALHQAFISYRSQLLDQAQTLLSTNSRRHSRTEPVIANFDYITLDAENPDHEIFFIAIQCIAKMYPDLQVKHARLTQYRPGDSIAKHSDTIPNQKLAVSWRLDLGSKSRLWVNNQLIPERYPVLFDPFVPHKVSPALEYRTILLFWLVESAQ